MVERLNKRLFELLKESSGLSLRLARIVARPFLCDTPSVPAQRISPRNITALKKSNGYTGFSSGLSSLESSSEDFSSDSSSD